MNIDQNHGESTHDLALRFQEERWERDRVAPRGGPDLPRTPDEWPDGFTRSYADGLVTITDLATGEQFTSRVHYDTREQVEWMGEQRTRS